MKIATLTTAKTVGWMAAAVVMVGAVACGDDETASTQTSTTNSSTTAATTGAGGTGSGGAGTTTTATTGATGGAGTGGSAAGGMAASYPAGPYGNNVGDTMANFDMMGFSNPAASGLANTQPYVAFSMVDVYQSARPYKLIHAAATF